jgi:hypothetical protein
MTRRVERMPRRKSFVEGEQCVRFTNHFRSGSECSKDFHLFFLAL